VQVLDSKRAVNLVSCGDLLNDLDGSFISSDGSEEFGRLVDGANKESTDPESDTTQSGVVST
jgi:hypothetical protein